MILLPTLPANNAENPVKTAGLAGIDSAFAAILAGETDGTEAEGGKILPEGGKDLPVTLPEALAKQIGRKILTPVRAEAAAETSEIETDADTGETEVAPKAAEVFAAIALAIELPLKLDPAQPAPAVEPEGEIAGDAPARAPGHKLPALPLSFPGLKLSQESAQSSEAATPPGDSKPGRHASMQAAQAFLAAFRQPADPAAKQPAAGPTKTPEQALATAAAEAAPAVAQDVSRPAKAARPQPRREITLEVAKQAKAAASAQPIASAPALSGASAAQAVASDAAAPAQGPKATDLATQNHTVRPHEFAALVDRLVEARESVRPSHANLNLMHADFGRVSVQFGQDNGNLTVSLANNDPGFVPAVNAAVAADASSNGDSTFQGRRDEGGQSASSRTAADSNTGDGTGRDGSDRQAREDRIKPQPQFASRGERKPLGGIFA